MSTSQRSTVPTGVADAITHGFAQAVASVRAERASVQDEQQTQHISNVMVTIQALSKMEADYQESVGALCTFLRGLKASPDQKIGKPILSKPFWVHFPESLVPKSGDTYAVLYKLREKTLKDVYTEFIENESSLLQVNRDLPALIFDCETIIKKTAQPSLLTFVHESWIDQDQPNVDPDATLKPMQRWGDMTSSSEDEQVTNAIASLTKRSDKTNSGGSIVLPQDFDECFPKLWGIISRFTDHFEWTVNLDKDVYLKRQGLIPFTEGDDGSLTLSQDSKPDDSLALASLYSAVAALIYQPQALVGKGDTEVAITYVCSLLARRALGKEYQDYASIALKSGDGGRALLLNRFLFLTKQGSSAIKMVFEAVDKLLQKRVREVDLDSLEPGLLDEIITRSYTSIKGMMENCYRKNMTTVTVSETTTNRQGKPQRVDRKVRKLTKSPPDLNLSRVPLKPAELTKLNELRESFNDRQAVIESRLSKIREPSIHDKPKVCREVVLEAYVKVQGLKGILRDRTAQIRQRALELSGEKKTVTPGLWSQAKAEVLEKTPDIGKAIYDSLVWS